MYAYISTHLCAYVVGFSTKSNLLSIPTCKTFKYWTEKQCFKWKEQHKTQQQFSNVELQFVFDDLRSMPKCNNCTMWRRWYGSHSSYHKFVVLVVKLLFKNVAAWRWEPIRFIIVREEIQAIYIERRTLFREKNSRCATSCF